ncbi:MAG: UDP-2,3-diacylglucosamine diphosphatase [Bacteroidaceae bacterium]|nr:UDP-2,3-diacylglucosamine diphosphatase [Bacteroidaceae bacterium]
MRKLTYFLSDAHLGSWAEEHKRMQERRLVRFLDEIKDRAAAIYLMGDIFDFWAENKYVVPKGYTRFLGKLSELSDSGVEIHYFTGNHDIWTYGYLEDECGVILHRNEATVDINGKLFMLAHGDNSGKKDLGFTVIRWVFHNKVCQKLFSWLHPDIAQWLGFTWARHSRMKREGGREDPFQGDDKEPLVRFAIDYSRSHPNIDFYIFGHRHIALDYNISKHRITDKQEQDTVSPRLIILGDWICQFTYAVFDGEHLLLQEYIEGESKM